MYYLKCNHCGYFNELKTEYLTFCRKCNKKLDVTFKAWSELHPGKTFEDFQKSVGMAEKEVGIIIDEKEKKRPRYLLYVIFSIAMGASLFLALAWLMKDIEIGKLFPGSSPGSVIEGEWSRKDVGNMGMSIETPFELKQTKLVLPPGSESYIEDMESHTYSQGATIIVLVNSIRYTPGINPDLQGAAEGSIAELQKQPGIKNLTYTQDDIDRNNITGFLQTGEFHAGIRFQFLNAGFIRGNVLYQVLIQYSGDDEKTSLIAHKIIDSVKIREIKANV